MANFTRQLPNPSTMMPESVCLLEPFSWLTSTGAAVPGTIMLSAVVRDEAAAFSAFSRPRRSSSSLMRATLFTAVVPP